MTTETQGNESVTEAAVVDTVAPEAPSTEHAAPEQVKTESLADTVADKMAEKWKSKTTTVKTTPEVPKYVPNHKFKVLDKEYEFEDWLKGAIKTPEDEKKAREFHEKAYGLDSVKQDRQTLKTENTELKSQASQFNTAVNTVNGYIAQKDYDSLFEALNVPKVEVLKYALELVKREQNPEQANAFEAQRQANLRAQRAEYENGQLQESHRALTVERREFELSRVLSRPDIATVAQAYEAGTGTPGAFKGYVIQIGQAYAAQGQDIPAEQAVLEAVKHLRAVNPALGVTATAAVEQTNPQVVQPQSKPVIPNIQGRGTSPVKSTFKSLDELKKRGKELQDTGL